MRKLNKTLCAWVRPEELVAFDRALSQRHLATGERVSRQGFLREKILKFIEESQPGGESSSDLNP